MYFSIINSGVLFHSLMSFAHKKLLCFDFLDTLKKISIKYIEHEISKAHKSYNAGK